MKTYPTYQEAKIANPECDIYHHPKGYFFPFEPRCFEVLVSHKCNPADYCVTVEQFLNCVRSFDIGDLFIDYFGQVVEVEDENVDRVNTPNEYDSARYILRAAALEKPKQISDTAREVFSTDSIPKIHKDSEFYKKPRTKVEFVKVEDSIWHLEADFRCGELFAFDGVRDYVQIETDGDFTLSHSSDNLYRRIETSVTWQEELYDYLDSSCEMSDDFDDSFTIEIKGRPLEFNLSDDEFVDMCKLVASLNSVN